MRRNHVRKFAVCAAGLALATLGMIAGTRPVQAGVEADVRAGVYPDADAVAIGGGFLASLGESWYFNPNLEVAMGDRRDIVAMSGDFHYDIATQTNTAFWVGGGPAILVTDREVGRSDTDVGLNVLTGLGAKHGQVRPFAQLRGTMASNNQIAIAGGIRF